MKDPIPYPGSPRWVKVLGIVALIAVLMVIVLLATRGPGGHGPGRHMQHSGGEDRPTETQLPSVENGAQRP